MRVQLGSLCLAKFLFSVLEWSGINIIRIIDNLLDNYVESSTSRLMAHLFGSVEYHGGFILKVCVLKQGFIGFNLFY